MGEQADGYIEQEIAKMSGMEECCEDTPGSNWWSTSAGKVIPMSDMNIGHLENAIAKIRREGWRKGYLPFLRAELRRRDK